MQSASGWRRHLPNQLTLLRLVMAVAFFATLETAVPGAETPEQRARWGIIAMVLFILGAVTDALDGWLARRWHAVSAFGRIMDPFVDKVLVLGAFLYLAAMPLGSDGPLPPLETGVATWMAATMLARELLVTSLRGWLEANRSRFRSRCSSPHSRSPRGASGPGFETSSSGPRCW
jgi:CDP-diacylglycerol--glycerol-3-phosphate 3-phosphatidyltransferase